MSMKPKELKRKVQQSYIALSLHGLTTRNSWALTLVLGQLIESLKSCKIQDYRYYLGQPSHSQHW